MTPSFFVGYLPAPPDVRRFAFITAALAVALSAILALALGAPPTPPGDGGFGDEVSVAGIYQARPYPIILQPPDAAHPLGHTWMLASDGKVGAQGAGIEYDQKAVAAKGVVVKRGDIDMLVIPVDDGLAPAPPMAAAMSAAPLGRWRIGGEICDGKCAAGAMAPGTGLAHKACANLCLAGGVPPVLVSQAPVEGRSFFLLADADGGPAPSAMADLTALPVTLEGDLERRGDLLVFRVDWKKAIAR